MLEVLTEVAILVSLFSAGIKMPVPFRRANWNAPMRLAWVSMIFTVIMVAAFGYFVLGLPAGAAILLGGVLAPTDPVLATNVQIRHAGDTDRLRFTLTCEAGMNDGSAAPFVFLGLAGSGTPLRLKAMTAWFGIRGIGSIYYLVFSIEAGLAPDLAAQLTNIVLFVMMLSIVVHGLSVKPLMNTVWRE